MGAVTFFEMTERERQVLVMTTQDKKNEPNASKMKPEVKVEPKLRAGTPRTSSPFIELGIVARTRTAPRQPPMACARIRSAPRIQALPLNPTGSGHGRRW